MGVRNFLRNGRIPITLKGSILMSDYMKLVGLEIWKNLWRVHWTLGTLEQVYCSHFPFTALPAFQLLTPKLLPTFIRSRPRNAHSLSRITDTVLLHAKLQASASQYVQTRDLHLISTMLWSHTGGESSITSSVLTWFLFPQRWRLWVRSTKFSVMRPNENNFHAILPSTYSYVSSLWQSAVQTYINA